MSFADLEKIMPVPSITSDDQGRFLVTGPNRYELPRDGADLYRRSEHFSAIWGDDAFFVCGAADAFPQDESAAFALTGDRAFTLSGKLAYNSRAPKGTHPQEEARAALKVYCEAGADDFPTMVQIRKQEGPGKGLKLLSGGAFVLIAHDFGDGPEIRIALFKRTFAPLVLTDGNGLVAEPHTAAKEALEEWGLISVAADGVYTVHAVDFDSGSLRAEDYLAVKQIQEARLRENLTKAGEQPATLSYALANIKEMTNLPQHVLTIRDDQGHEIDSMLGMLGEELDQNTIVLRRVGIWTPPADATRILVIDPEFDREGKILSSSELSAAIAAGASVILSSTAGIGTYLLDHWPRPTMEGKPAEPRVTATPRI
jgi:hypothetical protein